MSVDPEATPNAGNSADPQFDWESDANPYKKRFTDTQSWATKNQQDLAALQKLANGEDPDGFRQLLDKYGLELDETPDPGLDPDPFAASPELDDPRIAQLLQQQQEHAAFIERQQQQELQRQRESDWNGWENFARQKAQELGGVELTARDIKALKIDSIGEDGMPIPPTDAEKVIQMHLDERKAEVEALLEQQRKRPRVPHVPASGGPAGDERTVADLSPSELTKWMTDRVRAESA